MKFLEGLITKGLYTHSTVINEVKDAIYCTLGLGLGKLCWHNELLRA